MGAAAPQYPDHMHQDQGDQGMGCYFMRLFQPLSRVLSQSQPAGVDAQGRQAHEHNNVDGTHGVITTVLALYSPLGAPRWQAAQLAGLFTYGLFQTLAVSFLLGL